MTGYFEPAEHAVKKFWVYNWFGPGQTLFREGTRWVINQRQTKALQEAIRAMEVGEKRFLPFKHIKGEQAFEIERMA